MVPKAWLYGQRTKDFVTEDQFMSKQVQNDVKTEKLCTVPFQVLRHRAWK